MLRSDFNSPYCYFVNSLNPISINDLLKKVVREITYLLHLEDSTEKVENRNHSYNHLEVNNTREVIKTVFWIATSISIPLMLGL